MSTQANSPFTVTGVTVSLSIRHTNADSFVCFKAEAPEAAPGASLEDALLASIHMHLKAFESVLCAESIQGHLSGKALAERLGTANTRCKKILAHVSNTLDQKILDETKEKSTNAE